MDLSLPALAALVRETLGDPRGTARRLIALGLPVQARWLALAITAALSAILAHLTMSVAMMRMPGTAASLPSPVLSAVLQYGVLILTTFGVHHIGRRFGGQGRLEDALLLVVWLQFMLVCLQVAQLAAMLILPPLSDLIGLAGVVLFFWLLTAFVAELHGFPSMGRVFLGVLGSLFVAALVLGLLLSLILGAPATR